MNYKLSHHRCPRCEIRRPLCFCAYIPDIVLKTRVLILMHTLEQVLPTNTAKLVYKSLPNSNIIVHGRKDERLSADSLHEPGRIPLLLYPSSHATELSPEFVASLSGPVTLIVPDANWRQTQKFVRREPALVGIPHVRIPAGPPSEYHLRVQRDESGVCTLEAIARALGIIESPDAQAKLELLLRVMVERTLWSRGRLMAEQCTISGIPAEAFT
ncbi:tRNA-uridine aminocarboxypropyltransferase [Schlesneria paludicola]|uniref:tRNA-uridine aminocarboxypropyltransferase n=1 Tax=Schlesneria paludicola TaxID=360056 RepID=UPI00029B3028|nr:tRNA-uridine aminocarboxypropyltransferase [Schlesneria paludicola]